MIIGFSFDLSEAYPYTLNPNYFSPPSCIQTCKREVPTAGGHLFKLGSLFKPPKPGELHRDASPDSDTAQKP